MNPESRQDAAIRRGGQLLALLACAVFEAARFNAGWLSVPACAITACTILAALAAGWRLCKRRQDRQTHPLLMTAVLLSFLVVPSAMEWAVQAWFGIGQAASSISAYGSATSCYGAAAASFSRGHCGCRAC